MRRVARLWFIAFTVLRFGLDEVALGSFRQPWVRLLVRIVTIGRDGDVEVMRRAARCCPKRSSKRHASWCPASAWRPSTAT
jgi:hypothetical protein